MDGSLLTDAKQLPPDFFELVSELQKRGIIFAVASGRQYYTLEAEFFDVRNSIYFIAENGSYVSHQGEILYLDPIPHNDILELIDQGRKVKNAFPILCGKNGAYAENKNAAFLTEVRKYFHRFEIVDDLKLVKDDIIKFTLCDFGDAERNSLTYFDEFANRFKVTIGGKLFLDVTNLSANKGIALKQLQHKLGISADETLAFGDYLNDLEMMQSATYSYAMKNAHPTIIKSANYITEFDNNEFGVSRTIHSLGLANFQEATRY